MADRNRPIIAFRVDARLFNDIVGVLNDLPARAVRPILNRIEAGEVKAIFEGGDLGGHRKRDELPDAGGPGCPPEPPPLAETQNDRPAAGNGGTDLVDREGGQ